MITRNDVIEHAAKECMRELYSLAQPFITLEELEKENIEYSKKYKEWELSSKSIKNRKEAIGPSPYEFYYLPKEVMNEICDSYIYAYKFNSQQELLDTIEILKRYCNEPTVDKYIKEHTDEYGNFHPGYRSYDHPDNLVTCLNKITENEDLSSKCRDEFFKFLDMASNFYKWNWDLNSFNSYIYLSYSPSINKQAVIDNWKKYRNKDIEIDETKYTSDDEL